MDVWLSKFLVWTIFGVMRWGAICQFPLLCNRGRSLISEEHWIINCNTRQQENRHIPMCFETKRMPAGLGLIFSNPDHEKMMMMMMMMEYVFICHVLNAVQECTKRVDCPVICNRTIWDELEKKKDKKWLRMISCFFYVLYITIHFFSK